MNVTKKLLCLALALSLTIGLFIPATAASITAGQAQTVTIVNDETPVILRFVPTKSGYYSFYSYNSQGHDPYGYIMDASMEVLVQGDDTEDSLDFFISCYLTAGNTYYLAATCFSGSATYTVQIVQRVTPTAIAFEQDTYTGNLGQYLYPQILFYPQDSVQDEVTLTSSDEQVAYINKYGDIYLGSPGTATVTATTAGGLTTKCTVTVLSPPALTLDTPWTLDAALADQYLRFTAPTAGWYGIRSEGDEIDPRVEILDANLDTVIADDESLANHNFFAPVYLDANELCYFSLRAVNATGTAQVILQKLEQATAITFGQSTMTGYADTACWLTPVNVPQVSIPEELTWHSSNENVVVVDDTGYAVCLEPGNAVITVTSKTGKTASMNITVLAPPTGSKITAWGNCGSNLQWQLSDAGVLTITGSGDMYNPYENGDHWASYSHLITQVVLPEGLTGIGVGAFQNCSKLTSLTIPDSVRCIGYEAFSGCTSLTQVTLPKELENLGMLAFANCTALKEITLPNSLKRIAFGTFISCSSLSRITLPNDLISIADEAFASCAVKEIQLPATLKTLGYCTFSGTGLTQITLPEGLTELRDLALADCALEELTVPASVTKLGSGFVSGNSLRFVRFLGNAPVFDQETFDSLNVTAYYPAGNKTWTEGMLQDYGGTVTWIPEGNPGVTLSGTAKDHTTLTLALGDAVLQTLYVESGSYTFENLQPGIYTLTASAANHVPHTYTLTVTGQSLTQNVTIHLIGDIDGNGKVNVGDVAKLNGHIKGTAPLTDDYLLDCANVNGGKLNMGDSASLYAHIRGTKKLY